jgi:lysozyme family protein
MSSKFEEAFKHIIEVEGSSYTNRKVDRGGPTKYGISQRVYSEYKGYHTEPSDVKNMTMMEAREIYRTFFWEPMKVERLDTPLAISAFNIGVNRGWKTGVMTLQRALGVVDDGDLGPVTRDAAARIGSSKAIVLLVREVMSSYVRIAQDDPSQLANLMGWKNRAFHLIDEFVLPEI